MNAIKKLEIIKPIIEILIYISTFLLFLSINVPQIEAVPEFRVIYNVHFGWFGITYVSSILIFLLLLFYYFLFIQEPSKIDRLIVFLFFIFVAVISFNGGRTRNLFLYFLRMGPLIFLSRFYIKLNKINYLFLAIKLMTIVQIIIILYSVFVTPLGIERVPNTHLFMVLHNGVNDLGRIMGTIGHPLVLAVFFLPGTIIWFYEILNETTLKRKILPIFGFLLAVYCVFLTFTRGTWLVLSFIMFLIIIESGAIKRILQLLKNLTVEKRRIIFVLSILVISSLVFLFFPTIQTVIARFGMTTADDYSVSHRLEMLTWVIYHVSNNRNILIFGNGIGNTGTFLRMHPPSTNFFAVDNQYFTFLFEYGIIGFSAIMSLLFISLHRSYLSKESRMIFYVLLAMMMNAFTFELVSFYQVAMPFWLFVGLAIQSPRVNRNKNECIEDVLLE